MNSDDVRLGQRWRRKRDGLIVVIARIDKWEVRNIVVDVGWSTGNGRTHVCGVAQFLSRYELLTGE